MLVNCCSRNWWVWTLLLVFVREVLKVMERTVLDMMCGRNMLLVCFITLIDPRFYVTSFPRKCLRSVDACIVPLHHWQFLRLPSVWPWIIFLHWMLVLNLFLFNWLAATNTPMTVKFITEEYLTVLKASTLHTVVSLKIESWLEWFHFYAVR